MISLRQHLLTLVALFLALATGIVLGGGPLSSVNSEVSSRRNAAPAPSSATEQGQSLYTDSFVSALTPSLVTGRLEGQQVALITVPGVSQSVVSDLVDQVGEAGGEISVQVSLAGDMVDPAQKSLVDTLGSQLMTQQPKRDVSTDATTYDRMGELLGLAVASKEPQAVDATGKTRAILEALNGAALMEPTPDISLRAPLVLMVLGTDASNDGADAIVAGLVKGLAVQSVGVVLVGTVSDGLDGQLSRFRMSPAAVEVASVDGIDTEAGRIATIATLQRSLTTPGGAFGAAGADGPLPLG